MIFSPSINQNFNILIYFGWLPIMPVNARDSPGTSRDKAGTKQGQTGTWQGQIGTNRDIPFLSLLVPTCPCLSLSVHACPCLSLSVPVCPCLSLSFPVCPCHCESGEVLWLQGKAALQTHRIRDAEPQPMISPNANKK